ncbi:methylamine utilization protein [Permianibacter fluminis]|uniref:methylamine utilization protein n=1 Tax=Permianibacter fluminis TaxID=2738515 RepID=UPI001B7D842B|nr:methylamine utilization protein [Permianibacter fluminis]
MLIRPLLGFGLLLLAGVSTAAEFSVRVVGRDGKPVADAVLYVESAAAKPVGVTAEIDQINKEFVPYVSVVPVGSKIRFPNRDNIRHHVYSFSDAKKFELKLYSGVPSEPVTFDKAGVVALGCNIHDWMLAYVLVVDTPWFARSNEQGLATLQLPPGPQQLQLWHPDLEQPLAAIAITVTDHAAPLTVTAALRPRASTEASY